MKKSKIPFPRSIFPRLVYKVLYRDDFNQLWSTGKAFILTGGNLSYSPFHLTRTPRNLLPLRYGLTAFPLLHYAICFAPPQAHSQFYLEIYRALAFRTFEPIRNRLSTRKGIAHFRIYGTPSPSSNYDYWPLGTIMATSIMPLWKVSNRKLNRAK